MGRSPDTKGREDADLRRQTQGSLTSEELRRLDADVEVDALGTFCPEPVIRTQNRMRTMSAGQTLRLLADDGGVEVDIPAWCISTGNEYLGIDKHPDRYDVYVRKVEANRSYG